MPNIAALLKDEIARIARKEVRAQTEDVRKASIQYRSHIASLRRRIDELERELKRVRKGAARPEPAAEGDEEGGTPRRFSATRLAAQRKKLGLSAADFAAFVFAGVGRGSEAVCALTAENTNKHERRATGAMRGRENIQNSCGTDCGMVITGHLHDCK